MKVLQSLALLFFCAGSGCSLYVSVDPNSGQRHQHGPVAFVAAIGRIKKQRQVQPVGDYLLENMGILFFAQPCHGNGCMAFVANVSL